MQNICKIQSYCFWLSNPIFWDNFLHFHVSFCSSPQLHVKHRFSQQDIVFLKMLASPGQCPMATKHPWTLSALCSAFGMSGPWPQGAGEGEVHCITPGPDWGPALPQLWAVTVRSVSQAGSIWEIFDSHLSCLLLPNLSWSSLKMSPSFSFIHWFLCTFLLRPWGAGTVLVLKMVSPTQNPWMVSLGTLARHVGS